MKRWLWAVAVGCGMMMVFGSSFSRAESDVSDESKAGHAAHSGSYGGVSPEGGDPPQIKTPPAGLQYLTWPGFRAHKDGSADVFVQLTGPVSYKMRARGRRVDVTMEDVQVYLRNNLRTVLTQHFSSPVSRFRLRELKGNKLRLEIRLSRRRKPTVSIETKKRYTYLIVHFPPKI
jgi:hypothetical protein